MCSRNIASPKRTLEWTLLESVNWGRYCCRRAVLPLLKSAWALGRATWSSFEIGPALSRLDWRCLFYDSLGRWCCSQFMIVLRSCQQTEARHEVGSNREFSIGSFLSLWHWLYMKCAEYCANCFENVVAIYSCSCFRFSLSICKYIFTSCQLSSVVNCCIWEAQVLRSLEHLPLLLLAPCEMQQNMLK